MPTMVLQVKARLVECRFILSACKMAKTGYFGGLDEMLSPGGSSECRMPRGFKTFGSEKFIFNAYKLQGFGE